MKLEFSWQILKIYAYIKVHENPPGGGQSCSLWTERQDWDITKLIVTYRSFVNTPKMVAVCCCWKYYMYMCCCKYIACKYAEGSYFIDMLVSYDRLSSTSILLLLFFVIKYVILIFTFCALQVWCHTTT